MKDLKQWSKELERAAAEVERELLAQNAAFKDALSEWGTDEEAAAFAASMAFGPSAERKRASLPPPGSVFRG